MDKLCTPEAIAAQVESGWTCCTDIGASIPKAILDALGARAAAGEVAGVTLHTMLDLAPLSCLEPEAFPNVTPVSWFSGAGLRRAVNEGRAGVMPCRYSDLPALFRDHVPVDAFFCAVSPMDKHGYFRTGVTGSHCRDLFRQAGHIYLEVNDRMPFVPSAPKVHISQVTALCEHSAPLPILPPAPVGAVSRAIAGHIAREVPDGATLQLGIGAVPEAVGAALRDKHDLGLHTELFTDSMVELIACGAVTNAHKPLYRGRTVAALALGTKRVYDYLDHDPNVLLLDVDRVNDPAVIARHPNFISVNAALECDLFGQVCAESLGTRHISGSGGQADFVLGATRSQGGKSFLAFPSTAGGGRVSRIRATLSPGALVTTGKNEVDRVVTEYGVARLRGRTFSQRARALIAIAHPRFREELTDQAGRMGLLV